MTETPKRTGKKKLLRRLAWILGIAILILVLIDIFLIFFLSPTIGRMLTNSVSKASKEFYTMEYESFRLNIATSTVTIKELHLIPDMQKFAKAAELDSAPPNIYEIAAREVELSGISIWEAWKGDEILADKLEIIGPKVIVNRDRKAIADTAVTKFDPNDLLPEGKKRIFVKRIELNNGQFTLQLLPDSPKADPVIVKNIWMGLNDFHIDSSTAGGDKALFSADHFQLGVDDYSILLNDSLHRMHIGRLKMMKDNILMSNIRVKPDTSVIRLKGEPAFSYEINIPSVSLVSPDFYTVLSKHNITANAMLISKPEIILRGRPDAKKKAERNAFDLAKALPKTYKSLLVDTIRVERGSLKWDKLKVRDITVAASRLFVDTAAKDDDRLFYMDDIDAEVQGIRMVTNDNMYDLNVPYVRLNAAQKTAQVNKLQLKPRFGKHKFSEVKGHQTDRFDIDIKAIHTYGMNIERLVKDQMFIASKVVVTNMQAEVFRDKMYKRKEDQTVPMPQDLVKKLPFYVNVNALQLKNADVTYIEHMAVSNRSGLVSLRDVYATIGNITNDAGIIASHPTMTVDGTAVLMGAAKIEGHIDLPMGYEDNRFSMRGAMGAMKFNQLNSMIEPAMLMRITQGNISKLSFEANGNRQQAVGTMEFYYNDLEVEFIDKSGNADGLKQTINTSLANVFVIISNNPSEGEPLRKGIISYERDPSKSFVNYTWNMVLSGVKSSIGVTPAIQDILDKKKEKKERRLRRIRK